MGFKKNLQRICILIFLIMVYKPDPKVDLDQVSGYKSSGLARVTQATIFFYFTKKSKGFKTGFKKKLKRI